ncbi:unnamed protein product, partial [Amoebophrya sp. A120]
AASVTGARRGPSPGKEGPARGVVRGGHFCPLRTPLPGTPSGYPFGSLCRPPNPHWKLLIWQVPKWQPNGSPSGPPYPPPSAPPPGST